MWSRECQEKKTEQSPYPLTKKPLKSFRYKNKSHNFYLVKSSAHNRILSNFHLKWAHSSKSSARHSQRIVIKLLSKIQLKGINVLDCSMQIIEWEKKAHGKWTARVRNMSEYTRKKAKKTTIFVVINHTSWRHLSKHFMRLFHQSGSCVMQRISWYRMTLRKYESKRMP